MQTEPPPEGLSIDAALLAWPRKAINVLLIASAAGHLLPVILIVAGHGPRMTPWFRATGLLCYTVMVASAMSLSVDWRIRLGGGISSRPTRPPGRWRGRWRRRVSAAAARLRSPLLGIMSPKEESIP